MESRPWDTGTRLVHMALALAVIAQLSTGFVVSSANHQLWLSVHTGLGVLTFIIIMFDWAWTWARHDLHVLFPWTGAGMKQVSRETVQLFQGKLPSRGDVVGLPNFVHGIGLLAVSGMAVTGFLMYFLIPGGHGLPANATDYGFFTLVATFHSWLIYGVWFYLGGHLLFAGLNQVLGDGVFRRLYAARQ